MSKNHQKNLINSRRENPSKKTGAGLSNSASNPISTAKNALSLTKEIRLTDILFFIPFSLAILKDISDLFLVGSLWGVGTVISICCSILGGLYILLIGGGEAKRKSKALYNGTVKRLFILFGGTLTESFVMGVNFLPMQTLTFGIMYIMILFERSQNSNQEEETLKNIQQYA